MVFNKLSTIQGLFLVYDIKDSYSFKSLSDLINQIKKYKDISNFPIIIIGNKIDKEDERIVSTEEGKKFAADNGFLFFETSALTGKGVKEAFDTLIQMVFEKNQNSN